MVNSDKKARTRKPESIAEEWETRQRVIPLLESKGYSIIDQQLKPAIKSWEQIVRCHDPSENYLKVRVRVVWRSQSPGLEKWAAVQLGTRKKKVATNRETVAQFFEGKAKRNLKVGVTHNLFIERRSEDVTTALLVPDDEIDQIWYRQRQVYETLMESGLTNKVNENPALNGATPTICIRDERTEHMQRAAEVLWTWPSVIDLLAASQHPDADNDSFDDCPVSPDDGRDGGVASERRRSEFPRNASVRRKVRERANGTCENLKCSETRDWQPFLDVHHTMGIEKSDRVWTCVALCPNCHREAHFSPHSQIFNEELRGYAEQFKTQPTTVKTAP